MTTIFSVAVTIAITISASLILVLASQLRRQRKEEKLRSAFNEAAAGFGLSVTKQETLRNRIIGLDMERKKLLFLEASRYKYDGYLIDLEEIKTCKAKREYGPVNARFVDRRIAADANVNKIALEFNYKNGAQSLALPFYDKTTDPISEMQARGEQAKEWQALLTTLLTRSGEGMEKWKNPSKSTFATIEKRNVAYTENEKLLARIDPYC